MGGRGCSRTATHSHSPGIATRQYHMGSKPADATKTSAPRAMPPAILAPLPLHATWILEAFCV